MPKINELNNKNNKLVKKYQKNKYQLKNKKIYKNAIIIIITAKNNFIISLLLVRNRNFKKLYFNLSIK